MGVFGVLPVSCHNFVQKITVMTANGIGNSNFDRGI